MTPEEHAGRAEEIAAELDGSRYIAEVPALSCGLAQVHALLAIAGQIASFGDSLSQAARVLAGADHPPVPEQAATPEQADWIAEQAPLWAGWQPATWPVYDSIDPRGWRWANPLEGA